MTLSPTSLTHDEKGRHHQEIMERAKQKEREEARQAHIRRVLEFIPLRYRDVTWDKVEGIAEKTEQGKILRIIQKYVSSFQKCKTEGIAMIWLGKSHTGKTLFSWLVFRALSEAGFYCHRETLAEFVQGLQTPLRSRQPLTDHFKRYLSCDLLLMDDVNPEHIYVPDWNYNGRRLFYDVLNQRFERCKPTILITNETLPNLTDFLGEKSIQRVMGEKVVMLAFNWPPFLSVALQSNLLLKESILNPVAIELENSGGLYEK